MSPDQGTLTVAFAQIAPLWLRRIRTLDKIDRRRQRAVEER